MEHKILTPEQIKPLESICRGDVSLSAGQLALCHYLKETTLCTVAKANANHVMAGYTHLQRAQPVTIGHHLLAYVEMFDRDAERYNSDATLCSLELGICSKSAAENYLVKVKVCHNIPPKLY